MATRAIFEIDLQGQEKFKAFIEQFNKYKADLKSAPASWAEMEKISREVKNQFAAIADYARAQKEAGDSRNKNEKEISSVARATAIIWTGITRETGAVFSHVAKITGHLAKWSTLSAALGGLLGAGSLWGIDKLANAIAANRRAAMGLGVGYGSMLSAQTNLSPLLNPNSLMQNISTARFNQTSEQFKALRSMGISENKIKYARTEDVIAEVIDRAPQILGNDRTIWGTRLKAYGLENIMPSQDWYRLGNATPAERDERKRDMMRDARRMDVSDRAGKAWQDLTTQLTRSGRLLETALMEKLLILAQPLIRLSNAVTNLAIGLIDSPIVKDWIDALSSGLENLAGFVQTPAFHSTIESFITWVAQAAGAIWDFIASFSDQTAPAWAGPVNQLGQPTYGGSGGGGVSGAAPGAGARQVAEAAKNYTGDAFDNTIAGHAAFIRAEALRQGVNPDLALAIAQAEGLNAGGFGNPQHKNVGGAPAYGDFQNHYPGVANAMEAAGIDPRDPSQWEKQDAFDVAWMKTHGTSDWNASRGNWGRLYIMQNTGNNTPRSATLAGSYSQAQP